MRRWAVAALAAVAGLILVILVWVGWVAVRQWQQSLLLLAGRQAEDASERFLAELTRDMQGSSGWCCCRRRSTRSPAASRSPTRPTGP